MTRAWSEDLTGQLFGRLTVLSEAERVKGLRHWLCRCECEAQVSKGHRELKSGKTRSCGCLRSEVTRSRMTTHGHARRGAKTRAYGIWAGMIARCLIPSATGFDRYGGAGVTVCERWRLDFADFLADMGEPPDGMSIDRRDGSKGYEPGNCRWSPSQEQNENRKSVVWIEADGVRLTMAGWARRLGISKATLYERIAKRGTADAVKRSGVT